MNSMSESTVGCESSCEIHKELTTRKKVNSLEVVFSVILFVTAICGVWKASSLAISIVSFMQ